MIDPVASSAVTGVGSLAPAGTVRAAAEPGAAGGFAAVLRSQLENVSRMQAEADTGIQNLLTGQSQNVTEVFVAARKAEVAFGLLMEIRNKLTDAYAELRRMVV